MTNRSCVQGGAGGSPNFQAGPFSPPGQGNSSGKHSQGGSFGASHGGSFGQGGSSVNNNAGQDIIPLASLPSRRTPHAPANPEPQVVSTLSHRQPGPGAASLELTDLLHLNGTKLDGN